jgi:hypothetical protein
LRMFYELFFSERKNYNHTVYRHGTYTCRNYYNEYE